MLGVKLMPMFGMNCANATLPGFDTWGAPSIMRSASGLEFQGNRPDWDVSRAHDPGWQAWLNPGAPLWRERLVEQVSALVAEYDLPAVFFDTQHVLVNDPAYPLYEGILAVRDALKARFPELLIAGEGWYDALGAATPVSQVGAPGQWPEIFSNSCRTFLHLSAGDPSRGSTGVHELGYNDFRLAPTRRTGGQRSRSSTARSNARRTASRRCWPRLAATPNATSRGDQEPALSAAEGVALESPVSSWTRRTVGQRSPSSTARSNARPTVKEVLAQARRYAKRYL
jgi:hypothetical protein